MDSSMQGILGGQQMNEDYFQQKKFEIMLEMNNKKFATELSNMNATIAKLTEEIADLKRRMHDVRVSQTAAQESRAYSPPPVIERPIQQTQQTTQTTPRTEDQRVPTNPGPRTGNFKSEDVQIDKFFYFGNKRK